MAGLIVSAVGLLIIAGWYAHWSRLLQVFTDAAPMQYNAALCFVFCGLGLFFLSAHHMGAARWLGGVAALIPVVTSLEYLSGWNLGVDQLLFRPYLQIATAFPGRMAPLTAICFMLFGSALGLAAAPGYHRRRMTIAGLLAAVVGSVGTIAVLGYFSGLKLAYGWGAYSLMAFPTGGALIILGFGMLHCCSQIATRHDHHILQWVPIAASATLIAMVAVISVTTITSLRSALSWRKHTYEVLLAAQSFLVSVTQLESVVPNAISGGPSQSQTSYDRGVSEAPRQLAELVELTRDNPTQQRRLKDLTGNLESVLTFTNRLKSLRDREDAQLADQTDSDLAGGQVLEATTRAGIQAFIEEEHRLLILRSAIADADFKSTARLLGFGCVLAAIFFVAGTLLVRREINRRARVEAELREVNERVKTLSGLLPMCAHCNSSRDDQGYWTRIEAYLQAHSDAKFSHGLCEPCVRELYPSIADQVIGKMRETSVSV